MSEPKTKEKARKRSLKGILFRGESFKAVTNSKSNNETLRRWRSEENMLCKPPSSVPYYYGHITRENAELVLWERGCLEGMYLLRASHSRDAEYVLSVGHNNQVLHYLIQKSSDGLYHLNGATPEKFVGPIELIENLNPSSLSFRLQAPCLKPVNVFMPGVNCGIAEDKLQEALEKKAAEWGLKEDEMKTLIQNRDGDIWRLVFKTLHESEGWFHGKISRAEAEKRLAKSGHKNGKFLIRERDECSFSLSLSHNNLVKHYKIDVLPTGEVGIPDGPRFDNIISLVSHYSVFSDGLWVCLKHACVNQATPIPTSTSAISWPIERVSTNVEASSEPQPAFPLSAVNVNTDQIKRFNSFIHNNTTSRNGETEAPKVPVSELNVKKRKDSKSALKPDERSSVSPKETIPPKKIVPVRPPPPIPTTGRKPAMLPSENNNASTASSPLNVSSSDVSVKVSTATTDHNANLCPTELADKSLTSLNSSENLLNDGNFKLVNGKVPKKNAPVPKQRVNLPRLDLPKFGANDIAKVLKTISETNSSSAIKSPGPLNKEDSNTKNIINGSPLPNFSDTNTSVSPPFTNIMKTTTPTSASTPFTNLIAELKGHKKMNSKSPDSTTTTFPSISDDQIRAADLKAKTVCRESPTDSAERSSILEIDSQHGSLEPAYVEIDAEYESERERKLSLNVNNGDAASPESLLTLNVQESKWDDVDDNATVSTKNFNRKPPWTKEESELHFNTIKRHRKGPATIDRKKLLIQERLGLGNFGEVFRASFKTETEEVPCAVKTLRQDQIANGKDEILKEARMMTKMDHPHIVRLLGVSEGLPFLLIMELAPLGPLSGYLKRNPGFPNSEILMLMGQVALGMEYLESRQFVHRDLAARNVLLVNENFAKITDFGMSKALGLHSDYYTVEPQGRLPLKWYAPECIYYFKFSSKSDVWSFGITLWEAMGRGGKPYMGMTGREILQMFSNNTRLPPPENCPLEITDIMNKCWEFKPEDRPSFSQLVIMLREYQKT
ncbi:Tyrosine-protein kinase ZAP-70 [Chamberlinius hualienensis]